LSPSGNSMEAINDRFGSFSVTFGSLLEGNEGGGNVTGGKEPGTGGRVKGMGSHVISPAWTPDGIRDVDVLK